MRFMTSQYIQVRCRDGKVRPFLLPRCIRAMRPSETVPDNLYECGKCGVRVTLHRKGDLARHRCLEDIEYAMGQEWRSPANRSSDLAGDGQSREFVGLVAAFEDAFVAEMDTTPTEEKIAARARLPHPFEEDEAMANLYARDVIELIRWNECARRGEC